MTFRAPPGRLVGIRAPMATQARQSAAVHGMRSSAVDHGDRRDRPIVTLPAKLRDSGGRHLCLRERDLKPVGGSRGRREGDPRDDEPCEEEDGPEGICLAPHRPAPRVTDRVRHARVLERGVSLRDTLQAEDREQAVTTPLKREHLARAANRLDVSGLC